MRICYLANGQSVHTQKWVRYFSHRGYDVSLITFSKTEQIDGVKVRNLKYFSKWAYPFRIAEVRRAVREINPDVLHAHYVSHYGMYGALSGVRPFVVSAWGSDVLIDPEKSMVKKYAVKYVLRKADLITVDSTFSASAIEDLGGDKRKVRLIIHGVDLRAFQPVENKEKLKKGLFLPQSSRVVISTRNLQPIYDIGTLINSMPHVIDGFTDTYFLIVGDGPLRDQFEELACKLGVTEHARFVGSISNKEMPKFLQLSDIYVSTSKSDTRSISLLEAMACALPVIVTDLEGNRELIKDGVNGFLFSAGNFRALAEKMLFLLRDGAIAKKFGTANRIIAEKQGDYEKEMTKMEKLYKELVEANKA